jgi:hypothetical protein
MEFIIVGITTFTVAILLGYFIGQWSKPDCIPEMEDAWDDGFAVGADINLNVGISEFDLLIDDLNPVRKDPNHFKKSRGF